MPGALLNFSPFLGALIGGRCSLEGGAHSPTECNKDLTKKVARKASLTVPEFELVYKIDFRCAIRGHHKYKKYKYKKNWTPVIGETLICLKDFRLEAELFDKHAVGVYRTKDEKKQLVGHVPMKLSKLLDYFLMVSNENKLTVTVSGKRKREVGLTVPGTYQAMTNDFRQAKIFNDELEKISLRYIHF